MPFQKNYIQYPINDYFFLYDFYNIPFDKRDKISSIYLNYYDIDDNAGYINCVGTNEHIYKELYPLFELNQTVQQIEGKNIIHLKMNSISYILYPNTVKYYIIINIENNVYNIYDIITGQKTINQNNHEFMTIVEDNGLNEIYETDIEINVELIDDLEYHYDKNTIYFIPVNSKTNLIETKYISHIEFEYNNIESNNNTVFVVIIIIIFIILLLFIVIAIFYYLRYKKRNKINHISQRNLLNQVESIA